MKGRTRESSKVLLRTTRKPLMWPSPDQVIHSSQLHSSKLHRLLHEAPGELQCWTEKKVKDPSEAQYAFPSEYEVVDEVPTKLDGSLKDMVIVKKWEATKEE
jgi:hypothetical protein